MLPLLAIGQEGNARQGYDAAQAVTGQASIGTESARTETWRDHINPFQDPLRAEPQALSRPLAVPLPPDLLVGSHGQAVPLNEGLVSTELPCARRDTAGSADNPQQALRLLQEAQSASANGAEGVPLLSLPTAIHLSLCHNTQVRASWSSMAQQAAQLGQARSAYLPQVSAGIARQHNRLGYSGVPFPEQTTSATRQQASLSWRLWDFGVRGARVDATQSQLQAALRSQHATARQVLGDVLQAYGEVQAAQARLETQRSLRPLSARSVQSAERRKAGGAGSANDLLQATAALARTDLELSRSDGDLNKSLAKLTYLVGLPPGTVYRTDAFDPQVEHRLPSERDDPHQLLARSLDEWLAQTLQNHPAILAARAQLHAAQASLKAVQSEGMPTVDFNLSYYRNGRPDVTLTNSRSHESVVGVTLSIPLFDGFAQNYKVRSAQAQEEQKAIELQATEQQALQDIVQLHADAHAALNNLQAARTLFVASGEAAASSQRQYDMGAADIVQLNQSLSNLQQAQMELAVGRTEWNKARLRLWLQEASSKASSSPQN